MIPKPEERSRYCKRTLSMESLQIYNKRPRLDPHIDFDNDTNDSDSQSVQEQNEQSLADSLTLEKTVQLVIVSLQNLPDIMPPQFKVNYNKYIANGTVGDVGVVAKLITNEISEAGLGPAAKISTRLEEENKQEKEWEVNEEKNKQVEISLF